MAHMRSE